MNGILVVDKPAGWTSFDVIAKLRGVLATRKLGHSGTLDPMATGVLPVFVGAAAKAVDLQPDHDKAYRALVRFGLATDTGDVTGETLETSGAPVSAQQVLAALPALTGPQMQTPPMYSAVKVDGVPPYKLARQGERVERKARPGTIYRRGLCGEAGEREFWLDVECSKGTYVRTLVEELGRAVGCPACLAALRRTRAGAFGLEASHGMESIQAAKDEGGLERLLLPVDTVFRHLPKAAVDEAAAARLLNGAPTYRFGRPEGVYRLYGPEGFLGLGRVREDTLTVEKLFVERA